MKNTIILIALVAITINLSAQEAAKKQDRPATKSGSEILPEKGDFALGVQANSFLQYAGNLFGKTNTNGSPTFSGLNNTIFLKKYMADYTAIRATISLNRNGNTRIYNDVRDDEAKSDPLSTAQVQDQVIFASYNNSIGFGLEKRRGYGRLQGFYGASANIGFGNTLQDFTYGNAMSNSNPTPTSYNSNNPNTRTLTYRDSYFNVGVSPFVGVEYFVARKISLQGELGWGITYSWQNDASSTYETVLNGNRVEYSRNSGDDTFRALDYGNNVNSNIGVIFHF